MSLWTKVRNTVTKPAKDLWNNPTTRALGTGGLGLFFGPDNYLSDLWKVPDPDRPPINPEEMQQSMGLAPVAGNALVGAMGDRTAAFLRRAGANPAAQAAAQRRAETAGFLRLTPVATQHWADLIRQSHNIRRTQEGIPTTSASQAFLGGFGGAGGFSALGSLGGLFGGGGAAIGGLPSQQYITTGPITNPYTGQIQGGL